MKDGMKDRGKCDKIVRHSGCGKICGSKSDEKKKTKCKEQGQNE